MVWVITAVHSSSTYLACSDALLHAKFRRERSMHLSPFSAGCCCCCVWCVCMTASMLEQSVLMTLRLQGDCAVLGATHFLTAATMHRPGSSNAHLEAQSASCTAIYHVLVFLGVSCRLQRQQHLQYLCCDISLVRLPCVFFYSTWVTP